MDQVNYSSESPKRESKSKDYDRHRKKDRHHEKKSKRRRSHDKSKFRYRNHEDDYKNRTEKGTRDSKRDIDKTNERRMRDKHSRRSNDKKHKHRHHSKSPEKSRRRSSSSNSKSSPDREKIKSKMLDNYAKATPIASTSSSPQKSNMISVATVQQPQSEPKIELPAYYNPNVINLTKFAEQQKKRKLIWSNKKVEPAKDAAKWGGAKFSQDSDGTKASKFMRLMGIKDAPKPEPSSASKPSDELFSTMEHQYEVARQVTHISRGVGLGFGSRPF